ncbi:MAG: alpha-beta hydrolase superfamily lysophospholipase [Polaribacter sp.]
MIFSQEKFDNEKGIENIENYNKEEITTNVKKTTTVYGTFDVNIKLYGTLLTPKTKFDKILVIISGTGKISQKAHNYLTEYLLQNNIGVFRFDKRGVGKSTGEYSDFFQIYTSNFIKVIQVLKKSKSFLNKKIGFLGHSLGGFASIQAIENNIKPDFLIQWSAPIGKPRELTKYQIEKGIINYNKYIVGKNKKERIQNLDYFHNLVDENPNKTAWEIWKSRKKDLRKKGINKDAFFDYLTPHKLEFVRIDNTKTYKNIDFPTLVIIGKEDILVDPKQSKTELDKIGNPNIEFNQIDGLNHFMTKKGVDWKTNEIYNVDLFFKEYIVNWINELKI